MRKTASVLALTILFSLAAFAQASQQEEFAQDDVRIVVGPDVQAQRDSVTITWQTNNTAATTLRYGTDRNNLDSKEYQPGGSREHRVELSNLQPNTQYYFEILTNDGVVRNRGQFRTQGESAAGVTQGDSQGPDFAEADDVRIIEGPDLEEMQGNRAVLTWRTNNIAATHVRYGTDPNNPSEVAYEAGGRREHRLELTNLQPGQLYYFHILTRDKDVRSMGNFRFQPGQGVTAATGQQTAAPQTGQQTGSLSITNGPVVENVSGDSATIAWSTDNRSSTIVRYGTDPNDLDKVALDAWGTNHRVTLPNLQPNTTYHFQVESSPTPRRGAQTQTARGTFQTSNQGTAASQPQ